MATIDAGAIDQAKITGALGYTSEIFWHFFGRGKTIDGRIELLGKILDSGSLLTNPPSWKEKVVQVSAAEDTQVDQDAPPVTADEIYFAEPKMVCFADIPIHCLPIHAQRYQKFAFGFSKERLTSTYRNELRTVMLFTSDWAKTSLRELSETLLRKRGETAIYEPAFDVANFLKFESGTLSDECFQNIYLEREWRSLVDISVSDHLEVMLVPREALSKARAVLAEKLGEKGAHVSVIAWESLFGEEGKSKS